MSVTLATDASVAAAATALLPVLFLGHGGGPCFFFDKSEVRVGVWEWGGGRGGWKCGIVFHVRMRAVYV